jgi:hypothetical protein
MKAKLSSDEKHVQQCKICTARSNITAFRRKLFERSIFIDVIISKCDHNTFTKKLPHSLTRK